MVGEFTWVAVAGGYALPVLLAVVVGAAGVVLASTRESRRRTAGLRLLLSSGAALFAHLAFVSAAEAVSRPLSSMAPMLRVPTWALGAGVVAAGLILFGETQVPALLDRVAAIVRPEGLAKPFTDDRWYAAVGGTLRLLGAYYALLLTVVIWTAYS